MPYQYVSIETDPRGVATVTLNRPDIRNAFDDQMITELGQAFEALEQRDRVRLVVLRGAGKTFCAGADLNWMKRMKDFTPQQNLDDSYRMAGMYGRINRFAKPLIGCVHGAALGGGVGLAAVCDYVLAETSAQFGFSEVRLGILPGVISPYVIAKIGESAARAWFLSGERFTAVEAQRMGLVHAIAEGEDALHTALEQTVRSFLAAGPEAARKAKTLIGHVVALSREAHMAEGEDALLRYTVQAIANARVSPEGQEGMAALLARRAPAWVSSS